MCHSAANLSSYVNVDGLGRPCVYVNIGLRRQKVGFLHHNTMYYYEREGRFRVIPRVFGITLANRELFGVEIFTVVGR